MKINDNLVSIIVPVYKVEKVLNRCISSLINQTYEQIEIILIDDGSPDNCPSICEDYSKINERVTVIHQTNKGPAAARNAGIRAANGRYYMFVDSDDFIHEDAVLHMKKKLEAYSADIIISGFCEFVTEEEIDRVDYVNDSKVICMSPSECLSYMFIENEKICTPWAKLYDRKVFDGISYPEDMTFGEDMFVAHRLFSRAKKIILDEAILYYYCQNGASLVRSSYNEKKFGRIEATKEWLAFTEERYPQIVDEAIFRYTINIVDECSLLINEKKYRKLLIEMSNLLNDKYNFITKNKYLSMKDKLKTFLLRKRFYYIYRKMRVITRGE